LDGAGRISHCVRRPNPRPTIEKWAAFIVEHHLENGDWGNSGAVMTFDGHSTIYDHSREHVRGLAMIVLAHYLALTSSEG
jgi:hypothetical protein